MALTARSRTFVPIVVLLALALVLPPAGAFAVPSSKLNEARKVKAQIDRLDDRVEIAAEAYNDAKFKHAALVKQVKAEQQRVQEANANMDALQSDLNARAWSMYRNGPATFLEVLLQTEDFGDFAATWDLLRDLNEQDADAVIKFRAAKNQAELARQSLAAKEKAAAAQVKIMSDKKRAIEKQLAERKSMLKGLEREIAALKAAEDAEARRRAELQAASFSIADFGVSFPPPTRAPRSQVVNIAKRYLGAPYRWGADGPNSFDCSGFTMFVYRQVGVSLPHSSSAQFGSGERVSRANVEPGDLVFFGSPIHHVGIYVGGGYYIHAPNTGDVVKISPLSRGDYRGAVRP